MVVIVVMAVSVRMCMLMYVGVLTGSIVAVAVLVYVGVLSAAAGMFVFVVH